MANKNALLDDLERRMAAADSGPRGGVIEDVWILDDGRTGNLNRCLGLAAALGVDAPEIIALKSRFSTRLLDWLPVPWVFTGLPRGSYPKVCLAAGARGSRVLRWLKKQKPGLFAVQLMRPAGGWKAFDVVVMEAHDKPKKRSNVCVTVGAVNHITQDKVKAEAQRWEGRLRACPAPRLAVMVGGSSRHGTFGEAEAKALAADMLTAAKTEGHSLLISTSRRTGGAVTTLLEKLLTTQTEVAVHFWKPDDKASRDNPYLAYLGLSDAVVVTGDSISMVSEAATAGKPVYVWTGGAKLPGKFKRFLGAMAAQGRVRIWDGRLSLRSPAAGLMDTALAAGFVRARLFRNR